MLELDDIQHFLLARPPALAARYGFLTFRQSRAGAPGWPASSTRWDRPRRSVAALVDARWVTVAFTWNGLRALGVDEASLATFPEEFRQGMAARAPMLGDTGANHPDHWVGGLASPDLHAIVILFARDVAERERCVAGAPASTSRSSPACEALSTLDLEATPPFEYAHDHFGYRDRLSQPGSRASGETPTPGSGRPVKPGEFFLGYPDESGAQAAAAAAGDPLRNGSYLAYRRLEEHVGRVPRLPAAAWRTRRRSRSCVAAKLMGRWRSGAPLVLAPEQGRPGARRRSAAQQRLRLREDGPARLRRAARLAHPADEPARHGRNMNRRRMIRRGGTYGPPLPEGAPRTAWSVASPPSSAARASSASSSSPQNVWVNDPKFHELEQRARSVHRHPGRHLRHDDSEAADPEKDQGTAGVHDRAGRRLLFLPGIRALRSLAAGAPASTPRSAD